MEVNDTEKIVVMLFNSSLFVKPTPLNGSRGGALGPPPQPPNFRLKKKKSITEGRKAGRASDKKPGSTLARGLDPLTGHCSSIESFMRLSFPTRSVIDRCQILTDTFRNKMNKKE